MFGDILRIFGGIELDVHLNYVHPLKRAGIKICPPINRPDDRAAAKTQIEPKVVGDAGGLGFIQVGAPRYEVGQEAAHDLHEERERAGESWGL